MNTRERDDYELLLAAARASGRKGGQVMSRKFAAIRAAKRAAALTNGNDANSTQEK